MKVYICVSPSADITTDEIKGFIGPAPYAIIFTQWRGCAYHSCDIKTPHTFPKSYRHRILYHSTSKTLRFSPASLPIPYNDNIKENARKFIDKINISTPYISVHVRTEKLSLINSKVNGYTDCCLRLLHSLVKVLKQKHRNVNSVMTITDISSITCHGLSCKRHAKRVQSMLTLFG